MANGWTLELSEQAEKDLSKLDSGIRKRIVEKLVWLSKNFDSTLLLGLQAEFKDFYKFRVGDWRVIYKVNWSRKIIAVHYIDKRDKIYKIK